MWIQLLFVEILFQKVFQEAERAFKEKTLRLTIQQKIQEQASTAGGGNAAPQKKVKE